MSFVGALDGCMPIGCSEGPTTKCRRLYVFFRSIQEGTVSAYTKTSKATGEPINYVDLT
jgi:hypothetical protein